MREGLFWVIGTAEEWELLTFFAPSDSISHKDAWKRYIQPEQKQFRRVAYDYYPRGRVVIRNARATVFLNEHIATKAVIEVVCKAFSLVNPKIHAEGSAHYKARIFEPET